jgi:hypothetical protein
MWGFLLNLRLTYRKEDLKYIQLRDGEIGGWTDKQF